MDTEVRAMSIPTKDELFESFKSGENLRLHLEDGEAVRVHMWRISRESESGNDWMIWGQDAGDSAYLRVYLKTDPACPEGHVRSVTMEQYFSG